MNKSGIAQSVISLPKGGGAISGIGGTFAPDLHTGTGNLTVPIALPSGRNGMTPELSLVYSTGNGNGPFGLGWSLSVPGVSRDTKDGVPTYLDREDTFLLSGMERLIAIDAAPGETQYRPRTESAFARIVHRVGEHDDYWEVRTRNGLVSHYGRPGARGHDTGTVRSPDDPLQVFSWSLTSTTDPCGNVIEYLYERDEANQQGPHRWDQTRLKTIRYADYGPRDIPAFLVTVDFVYEDRPDPFSTYRAGFEIRSVKRCTRIEIRTHADEPRLARVYHLRYADELGQADPICNGASLLRRIELEGIDGDAREALPPLEFDYTRFRPEERVYQPLIAVGGAFPDRSLAHPDYELADLFGSGLPDVVQLGEVSRYWRNLGDGRFEPPRTLHGMAGVRLGDPSVTLADLDGDGHIDVVVGTVGLAGYVPLTAAGAGEPRRFVHYTAAPTFSLEDPDVRLVDLDGDGVTDALRTGASFELYYHDRERGWTRSEVRARDHFDRFPDVYFSDPRVKLADMTGDGLTDIVFVDHGRVDYWPYLGNGRWGRRVTMSGRIVFPDATMLGGIGFDPKRVLLGDVDGDGCADLVYVESGRVTIWLNQQGNGWSAPIVLRGTPPVTDVDAVRLADMFGHGTAGILWTYDVGRFRDSSYKFLDLTGGTKPYLLCERDNHAGARTRIEYAPATRFYVEDERSPHTRWRGRLPFPVQVVSRVEVIDAFSQGKLTTEYRYHQGYWDGEEREFRGFGLVEQLDTETFARYHTSGLHGDGAFSPIESVHFSPPTLTRTWFHQGEVQDHEGKRRECAVEGAGDRAMFTREQRTDLADIARRTALAADPRLLRDALRALRGSVLRTELYALDDSPRRDRPYTVTESLYDVREVAAGLPGEAHRVFFASSRATRTTHWERGDDPMTRFSFTSGYDEYGLAQEQLDVAVPRSRNPFATLELANEPYLATYAVTEYARRDDVQRFIVDRVARRTEYEVINDGRPSVVSLGAAIDASNPTLRVIGHTRTFYDGNAFAGLPLGQLGDFGIAVRREVLAFQDAFLADVSVPAYLLPGPVSWPPEYPDGFRTALPPLAGYVHYADTDVPGSPGGYYVVSERHRYDFHDPSTSPRGLLRESLDLLGAATTIEHDAFALLPVRVTDAVGLVADATHDYRVLAPRTVTDPNRNTVEFHHSPTGLLVSQLVRGKHGEGDATEPSTRWEYDLRAFDERREPMSVRTVRRIHHDTDLDVDVSERDNTIESVEYSDGFGRPLQQRAQAEDTLFGDPIFGGGALSLDPAAPSAAAAGRTHDDHVVVTGWQIYDNKGRVVEKFEPFFSRGFTYRRPEDAELGQKATLFYDARGQLVRTRNPDGSETLAVLGIPADLANPVSFTPTPWESFAYDTNDNAGRTHGAAAAAFEAHWNTPSSTVVDALGRVIAATVRNGPDPATDWFTTQTKYDIQGNILSITDPLGREAFRYTYDLAKRRWRMDSIDAGRRETVVDAVGQPVEDRDAKGALTLQSFDSLHRPTHTWARDTANAPVTLRHLHSHGDGGTPLQPVAERDAMRERNLLGRLASQHDAAGVVRIHAADFKGNVVEKSRRVIADAPIVAVFTNAPSNGWQIDPFTIDWKPAPGETLADREAILLEPSTYETSATFDALGRTKKVMLPRDVEGRRRELHPTYNRAGALERVHLDENLYVDRIAYDACGRRTLIAYGNGVMTRYAYDPQSFRLARMRSEQYAQLDNTTYAPSGVVVQDCTYAYDLAGNILSITDWISGSGIRNNPDAASVSDPLLAQLLASGDALIRRFSYDPIYRLQSATGRECDRPAAGPPWLDAPRCTDLTKTRAYVEQYHYDAAGNLKSLRHQSASDAFLREYAVEPGSNRIQAVVGMTPVSYARDDNGNTLSESSSRHFEWNHGDQLNAFRTQTTGAEPSVHVHYLYDAGGQRVKKLVRSQGGRIDVTHYIDGTFEHHRWRTGSSSAENNHVHLMDAQQRIALVRIGPAHVDDAAPAIQYVLGDHLGSSHAVLDNAGTLINREEYTPYGETSFGSFAKKRYRFTGMERDEESSLAYHGARYYAPWLARWTSADPAGPSGGLNLFAYAGQNPIASTDRTGRQPDVAAFNKQISSDNLITMQELQQGLNCSDMTLSVWADEMSTNRHGYRLDKKVEELVTAVVRLRVEAEAAERLQIAERARSSPNAGRFNYGLNRHGNYTPSDVEAATIAKARAFPAKTKARNLVTFTWLSFTAWQPELAGAYHIIHGVMTDNPDEVRTGVFGISGGVVSRGLARSGGTTIENEIMGGNGGAGGAASGPQKLYRIIRSEAPEENMLSNYTLGKKPVGPEKTRPEIHQSVSTFDTPEAALDNIKAHGERWAKQGQPARGVAEINVTSTMKIEKTFGPGHYSVWAEPAELVANWIRSWLLR